MIIISFFIITLIFIGFYYQKLLLISFDEELAISSGVNVKLVNLIFTGLIGAMVAISIKIIGTLLIGALMIIPVISAICLKQSFIKTWILSAIFGILSVIIGLTLSFYVSIPSGATIVIVLLFFFLIMLLISKK